MCPFIRHDRRFSTSCNRNINSLKKKKKKKNVELSSDDLSEIDGVFSSHAVKGGWYFDTVPDEKLHLWG